jgi:hypothetical protein
MEGQRELASYYHSISSETLGFPDPDAAIGNALKGLVESPIYTNPPYKADIPLAVEFYYLGRFTVDVVPCCLNTFFVRGSYRATIVSFQILIK